MRNTGLGRQACQIKDCHASGLGACSSLSTHVVAATRSVMTHVISCSGHIASTLHNDSLLPLLLHTVVGIAIKGFKGPGGGFPLPIGGLT
jgi:hypothetical protein